MNTNIKINNLTKDDLDKRINDFLSLEPHWTSSGETIWNEENFKRELPGKFDLSLCAVKDNELAGYAIGSVEDNTAKLNKIVTHTDYRGQGIGTSLWNMFLENCRAKKVEKLEFKVLLDNLPAIKIYNKAGCSFNGITKGEDEKDRRNVTYFFKASKSIPHSLPELSNDSIKAVVNSMKNGNLATGPYTEQLISTLKKDTEKKYGVGFSSGSNAIFVSLKALGIKKGDEVILPSYLCGSVLHAVENTDAYPIFADNEFDSPLVSIDDIINKLSSNTKAIIVPHLFGKTIERINSLLDLNIPIIEDCAQSLGASYNFMRSGSLGDISIYSFYPTKLVSSFSGGVALTNKREIYENMKNLIEVDNREEWGEAYSVKMRDVDAALASREYQKLSENIIKRNKLAHRYNVELPIEFKRPTHSNGDVYFRYVVTHCDANEVIENLNSRNVDVRKPIFNPLHRYKGISDNLLPNASLYHEKSISLPIYPSLNEVEVTKIISALHNWRYEK